MQQIQQAAESAKESDNTKLQALQAWRSGRLAGDLMGQVDSLQYLGDDFSDPMTANTDTDDEGNAQSSGMNLSLSFGASRSEQTRTLRDDRALGTSLIADGDITIQARGDSAREGSGDITSVGSLIEGRNINLDAADDIRLLSAENTHTDDSDSKSSSAGIGISIGSDGLQLYVEGSLARGEINQSNDRYLETQLNAEQSVSLTSGNDTRLEGAQVNAERILADIGGDLSIISQQDEEHYSNQQQSLGVKVGVGIGPSTPVNLSLNYSELDAKSEYIAVQEQSGLFAGAGGFDVQVGGNTDLQGGAIVSDSDPANNRLSTETLTYNALNNHAEYDIDSMSIGISTSLSGNMQNLAQGLGGGFGSDSGEASNTTYAAISDGNIEVRSNPGQRLDDLKRSKEEAHRVLERIFSDDKVDAVQEQVELTQVFAEEAYLQVGHLYRDLDNAEAMLAAAERRGDPELIALWQDRVAVEQAKLPLDKSLAHALVGGMTAVLGGGDFTQGALAAGVNEAVAAQLKEQLGTSATLNNLAKVLIGSTVGGTPGGLIAGTADLNNRQLHPTEIDLIEASAEAFAERLGITDTELATAILTEVALNGIDRDRNATADNIGIGADTLAAAQAFLKELAATTTANNPDGINGAWFTATDKAFNDALINADRLFPQSEDLDAFGFDAAEGLNQRRDYTDFYERFAAVKDPVAAKQSTLDYAKAALADKGVNLADALTSKETWIAAYDGAVEILSDDNPFLAFADSQLKGMQGDHALSDALKAVETQAVIYELQGDEETANRLRGQATAEILVAEIGAATNATGVGVSTKVGSVLTGKLNDLAGAAKQKLASNISSKIDQLAMSALIDSGGIIDKTGTPLLDLRVLTREQKGILGDLFGAETVKRIVPEGQKLARVPGVGETGIDDLYKVNRADVDYVVIEYKFVGTDSKTGAQSLGRTKDGRQGSDSWTLGSGRIEKAVGEKNATAIYKAIDNNRVETWVVTTRADGATEIQVLDALGVAKEIDTSSILNSTMSLTGAAP
ncbi:hemagglutinin repeat-containing protein [Marinobacterium sp. D7]|nr:hemagglutinin repeat-containing protein [Marinobacterium ramblicola]